MDATRNESRSDRILIRAPAPAWLAVFGGCLGLLLYNQLKTSAIVVFIVFMGLYTFQMRRQLWTALAPTWPLLILPALALFSTVWSDAPSLTLKAGIQYLVTFYYGLLIARTVPSRTIVSGLLYALFFTCLLCLFQAPAALREHRAMVGIFASKNFLSFVAATLALLSLGVLLDRRRAGALKWTAWVGLPVSILITLAAQSAGSFVATIVAAAVLLLLTALSRSRPALRLTGLLLILAAFPVLLVSSPTLKAKWEDVSINVLHKDATISGRTYLWQRADELAQQRPLIGHGYQAFWRQGSLDAEGLWAYMGVPNRSGFNFHNQFKEVRVDLGWTGVVVLFGFLAFGLFGLAVRAILEPSPTLNMLFAVLLSLALRIPVETLFFYQFSVFSVLFVTCTCIGVYGPLRKALPFTAKAVPRHLRKRRRRRPPTSAVLAAQTPSKGEAH